MIVVTFNVYGLYHIQCYWPEELANHLYKVYRQFVTHRESVEFNTDLLGCISYTDGEIGSLIKVDGCKLTHYIKTIDALILYLNSRYSLFLVHSSAAFNKLTNTVVAFNKFNNGSASKTVSVLKEVYYGNSLLMGDDRVYYSVLSGKLFPLHRYVVLNRSQAVKIVQGKSLYWILFHIAEYFKGIFPVFYQYFVNRPIKIYDTHESRKMYDSAAVSEQDNFMRLVQSSMEDFEVEYEKVRFHFGEDGLNYIKSKIEEAL